MAEHQKVNILMVDDQPGKLVTYEAILNELDENLIQARSGKEALDHLLKTNVAVVLMDVSMPELDGFELADMIRQHPRFQNTAIILISAVHLNQWCKQHATLSPLLHPPLLDEIGLLPAIRMFAAGFGERSNVKVTVELSPEIGRLPPTMEISIFRIVQECLTNVYRHSGSKTALIRIWPARDKSLSVQVCDEGKGIPFDHRVSMLVGSNHGVYLSGMRERVRELGGTLEIHSNGSGTTVTALLPVTNMAVIGA